MDSSGLSFQLPRDAYELIRRENRLGEGGTEVRRTKYISWPRQVGLALWHHPALKAMVLLFSLFSAMVSVHSGVAEG